MTTQLASVTAEIIEGCFSPEAIALAAQELGVMIAPGSDIFQALIAAGKAADFGCAVRIVARHLETQQAPAPGQTYRLSDGRVQRRRFQRCAPEKQRELSQKNEELPQEQAVRKQAAVQAEPFGTTLPSESKQ